MSENNATLIAHCGATKVDRETLRAIPMPEKLGARHKPVPHIELVETLDQVLDSRGLVSIREEFATYKDGLVLFGVMDVRGHVLEEHGREGQGFSLGFRGGNDKSMSLQIAVGLNIFVCDNMVFSADLIAMRRKHTSGLRLRDELTMGINTYCQQMGELVEEGDDARRMELVDTEAKMLIYDQFARDVLPGNRFSKVHKNFFDPAPEMTDCQGRTLWALHNAFTREVRDLKPARRFTATNELGRLLRYDRN